MGLFVRIVLSSLAMLFISPFAAMLSEPFYAEFLKGLGVDTSRFGGAVAMLVSQLWFQLISVALVGAAIGAWMHWAAIKFDRTKARFEAVSYTLERSDCRWHIILHNESEDATFGAVLNLVNFKDWQAAPVGSVLGTWRVNTEAAPWKKVMKGERAAMPLCAFESRTSVFFFEGEKFGLCMKNTQDIGQEEEIVVDLKMQENPNWSRRIKLKFSDGTLVVTSSELPLHQSHLSNGA